MFGVPARLFHCWDCACLWLLSECWQLCSVGMCMTRALLADARKVLPQDPRCVTSRQQPGCLAVAQCCTVSTHWHRQGCVGILPFHHYRTAVHPARLGQQANLPWSESSPSLRRTWSSPAPILRGSPSPSHSLPKQGGRLFLTSLLLRCRWRLSRSRSHVLWTLARAWGVSLSGCTTCQRWSPPTST